MRGYLADLRTVAAWQACAVLLTATGVFSQTLAARGVHAPTAQSFFNYALLSLHGIWLLFRSKHTPIVAHVPHVSFAMCHRMMYVFSIFHEQATARQQQAAAALAVAAPCLCRRGGKLLARQGLPLQRHHLDHAPRCIRCTMRHGPLTRPLWLALHTAAAHRRRHLPRWPCFARGRRFYKSDATGAAACMVW